MSSSPSIPAQVYVAWQALQDFASSRSTPELASIVLATLAFPVLLLMTLSRYHRSTSPFDRSPTDTSDPKVSDADFTYITSEEVRRGDYDAPSDKARKTDVLTLVEKGKKYLLHFPAHSIDREELSIGALRAQALRKLPHSGAASKTLKLFYKGKELHDDRKSCRAQGLRQGAEILCSLVDASSDSDSENSDQDSSRSPSKRKRKSGKSKKRKSKKSPIEASAATPAEALAVPLPTSANASRTASPQPPSRPSSTAPPTPQTPAAMLDRIASTLDDLAKSCHDFKKHPPPTTTKREFEHKRLGETILTQVLLKLDAVDTDEPNLRMRRKELVRIAQDELKRLDDCMTSA